MNKVITNTAFKYGSIGFLIYLIAYFVMWQVNLALFLNPLITYPIAIIILVFGIYAQKQAKSNLGGYISFGNVFLCYVITVVIALLGFAIASILIFNIIDPAAREELLDLTIKESIEMSNRMLKWIGMDAAAGQLTEEQMRKSMQLGPTPMGITSIIISYISNLAFYSIAGLISAAIIKKDKPYEFE